MSDIEREAITIMSSKSKIIFTAVSTVAVLATAITMVRYFGRSVIEPAAEITHVVSVATDVNWPMFHAGPDLRGYVPNALPDAMKVAWKFKTNGPIKSSAAIDDGVVFIGSTDANLYALDLKKGTCLWAFRTGETIEGTACVVKGTVFVGSSDDFFYALDARTGQLKWKYQTQGKILGSANWMSIDDVNTAVLVGSYDNNLYCLNWDDGRLLWKYTTDSFINGTAAITSGKVVFGGCDGKIHVVEAATGYGIRRIDSGAYIPGAAAVEGTWAYIGNYDKIFMKVDIESGHLMWKYTGCEGACFSSPATASGLVVFGGRDSRVHCVNTQTGKRAWTFQTLGEVDSSPAICADKVLIGCNDGRVYMLRLTDGKKIWSFEIGAPVVSSPAIAGELVIVGADDGYVYAFGSQTWSQQ